MDNGGVRQIPLTRGYVALIDEVDFERVSAKRWAVVIGTGRVDPRAQHYWREGRKVRAVGMSRFILDAPPHMLVDHINGDPLDNRRSNLRLCTHQQNMCNRRKHSGGKIGANPFKGVYRQKPPSDRFFARIRSDGCYHNLGTHATAEAAARAYDEAATRLHGEFARLNFPVAA